MKTSAKSGWLGLVLALGAGALLGVSFPKFDFHWLAWCAPGLLLWATGRPTGWRTFSAGFVAGLANYLVSLYWLLLIPFPWHGLAGYLGLCGVLSLFMATWCWGCWSTGITFGKISLFAWPLFCAAAWVTMEMLFARVLTGFPWNLLGTSQIGFSSLIQIASVTGVYGVSFIIVWLSVSVMNGIWLVRSGGKVLRAVAALCAPVVAVTAVLVFGAHQLAQPESGGARLKIALVQPSIPQYAVWDPAEKTNRFLKLMELSRAALEAKPDLIVWPEAAMPDIFSRSGYLQAAIMSLMGQHPVWMVLGAGDTGPKRGVKDPNEVEHFNSAFLISPKGELVDRYYKRHLVPFGEYMPGAQSFPILGKLRTAGAGVTMGQRAAAFQIGEPTAKFPILICFEDMFPQEVRRRVGGDTDFMLNLTSDAWFGEGAAQWQHAAGAAFRAVENGVPLVRCCNNGLTCWIDARGRMRDVFVSNTHTIYGAGFEVVEVPITSNFRTFYNRHGDWFGWACWAIALVASGAFWIKEWRGKTDIFGIRF